MCVIGNRIFRMHFFNELNRFQVSKGAMRITVSVKSDVASGGSTLGPMDTFNHYMLDAIHDGSFWSSFLSAAAVMGGTVPPDAAMLGFVTVVDRHRD